MRLFRPATSRRSNWSSIAQDRSAWWALQMGLATDREQVDDLRVGHLVGRVWPDASPGAVYLAADLTTWAYLFRARVADPAFPADAVASWGLRLVDAFTSGRAGPDDPFARGLADLRRRWAAVCDPACLPAASVELGRFVDALRVEAGWEGTDGPADLTRAVDNRALTTALPLLLTCTPSSLAPPLGVRETSVSRALVRAASAIAAWSTDLAEATLAGDAAPPNLVGWLGAADQLGFDDALRRAGARHDGCVLGFAEAADAARRAGDADQVWLAHTLVDFVDGWAGWAEERRAGLVPSWRPSPFRASLDRIAS